MLPFLIVLVFSGLPAYAYDLPSLPNKGKIGESKESNNMVAIERCIQAVKF